LGKAVAIIRTLARAPIEQTTGNIGGVNIARIFIFQLVEAASTTAIAQRFPLRPVERL